MHHTCCCRGNDQGPLQSHRSPLEASSPPCGMGTTPSSRGGTWEAWRGEGTCPWRAQLGFKPNLQGRQLCTCLPFGRRGSESAGPPRPSTQALVVSLPQAVASGKLASFLIHHLVFNQMTLAKSLPGAWHTEGT